MKFILGLCLRDWVNKATGMGKTWGRSKAGEGNQNSLEDVRFETPLRHQSRVNK